MSQKKIIKTKTQVQAQARAQVQAPAIVIEGNDVVIDLPDATVRTLVPESDDDQSDGENVLTETVGAVTSAVDTILAKRRTRTKKVYPPTDDMFEELIKSMCDLRDLTRKIINLTRETQKSGKKEIKDLNLRIKKEKNEKPTRKPRGFALPSPISNEMVDYLVKIAGITHIDRKVNDQTTTPVKIEYGCLLARNELTSALCNHFRSSLMRKNDADKRDIHLDDKTTKLFGINKEKFVEAGGRLSSTGEPIITYFDLQKYLPKHCGKQAKDH